MEMLTPLKNPRKNLIFWNCCVIIKAVDTVIGDCISRHPNIVSTKRAFCAEYPYYLAQSAFCIERLNLACNIAFLCELEKRRRTNEVQSDLRDN